ncbi:MAG: tRNA pseudouridine(38-40) synthase TruA [Candidatus Melainabacteria bacterium GWF2_32_7]|nr:MAG: tRNA pseudouridine(38-40) synthase TruA [Candidatus Melainabacteria bacterium GWF2_32_7]
MKHKYALKIQYLGTTFSGSQIQPAQRTIQSEIEHAINILTKENNKTVFSGRTDAGVHALSQIVHFDTEQEINKRKFVYSLNALLPDEISVKGFAKVDEFFHSQKSARYRWYRYIINNTSHKSILLRNISLHIPEKLNVQEMHSALSYLNGHHDFSSFKSSNTDNPATHCNILYSSCRNFSGIIYIDLIANRFLYNMVRTITGTLIEIGGCKYTAEHMADVLEAKNRKCAGPTADARGLTLMSVGYDERYNLKEIMNTEAINEQNVLCKAS